MIDLLAFGVSIVNVVLTVALYRADRDDRRRRQL